MVACKKAIDHRRIKQIPTSDVLRLADLILTLSSIYTHFNTLKKKKKKNLGKTLCKKVKLLKMRNFTLFHNVLSRSWNKDTVQLFAA